MNARYILPADPDTIGCHYQVRVPHNFPPRYNIAPSQPVPIIRNHPVTGERELTLVRWGFVPGWDVKGTFFKKATINIRSESAPEKNSFRHAWRRRRCLFPMNGYYEWMPEGDIKQPFFLCLGEDMPLFSLAGLWEHWQGEEGSEMETAAFLTREGFFPLTGGNDRVPVFVPESHYNDWLDTDETNEKPAYKVIGLPEPELHWWRVSRRVNSWKAEGQDLVKRIDAAPEQTSLF